MRRRPQPGDGDWRLADGSMSSSGGPPPAQVSTRVGERLSVAQLNAQLPRAFRVLPLACVPEHTCICLGPLPAPHHPSLLLCCCQSMCAAPRAHARLLPQHGAPQPAAGVHFPQAVGGDQLLCVVSGCRLAGFCLGAGCAVTLQARWLRLIRSTMVLSSLSLTSCYQPRHPPCSYFQQGTRQQLLAANALKAQGWRFHTQV